jgi:hypothetical protein
MLCKKAELTLSMYSASSDSGVINWGLGKLSISHSVYCVLRESVPKKIFSVADYFLGSNEHA